MKQHGGEPRRRPAVPLEQQIFDVKDIEDEPEAYPIRRRRRRNSQSENDAGKSTDQTEEDTESGLDSFTLGED